MTSITFSTIERNSEVQAALNSAGPGLKAKVMAVLQVICGMRSVGEAAASMKVSRQTIHTWVTKVLLAIIEALKPQPTGPKIDWEKRARKLEEENKRLRRELAAERRYSRRLTAAYEFMQILFSTFDLDISARYRHFSPEAKLAVVRSMEQFVSLGGSIKDFSRAVGKCYDTLRRWWCKAHGKPEGEALEALRDDNYVEPHLEVAPEVQQAVIDCHNRYPHWGPKKISEYLKRGGTNISKTTVRKILKFRCPDWDKPRRKKRCTFNQVGAAVCLDHAVIDVGSLEAKLLLIMDETSRFILGWAVTIDTSAEQVFAVLIDSIKRYSFKIIKTDNAPEFRERFSQLVKEQGLFHLNSPYYHTPFNGKVERLIREFRRFLENHPLGATIHDLVSLYAIVAEWVRIYNEETPHEELGWHTPEEVFTSGVPPEIPSTTEVISMREEEGKLILHFTNRDGNPARIELETEAA